MKIYDFVMFAWVWIAGLMLGVVFFGGLWWTVLKGITASRPTALFVGSWLLRMGIVLTGFYLVGGADWRRWVMVLFGFVVARWMVTRLADAVVGRRAALVVRGEHAP